MKKKDIPNDETIAAINEVVEMKKGKKKYKCYSSFDEIVSEIKNGD